MPHPDPFDSMYESRRTDQKVFGKYWMGPFKFEHGKDTPIAFYKAEEGSDGMNVEVECCAMPARFYKIRVLPTPNSVGEMKPGFTLTTGSSCAELAAQIAEAARDGMLGLEK